MNDTVIKDRELVNEAPFCIPTDWIRSINTVDGNWFSNFLAIDEYKSFYLVKACQNNETKPALYQVFKNNITFIKYAIRQ